MKTFIQITKTIVAASALIAASFSAHAESFTPECKASVEKYFDEAHTGIQKFVDPEFAASFKKMTVRYVPTSELNRNFQLNAKIGYNWFTGTTIIGTSLVDKHAVGYIQSPDEDSGTRVAEAEIDDNVVDVDPSICEQGDVGIHGVMYHEIGHFLTYYSYPDFRHDMKSSHPVKHTYAGQEQMANLMGGRMMAWTSVDAAPYVAMLTKSCDKGSQYDCDAARNWEAGKTF